MLGSMPTHKFSDAAKSALLFFIVMPGGGSVFGTLVAAVPLADANFKRAVNLPDKNHTL